MITKTTNTTVKALPKGEFFKIHETSAAVYVRGEYSREYKAYFCHKFDDVNIEAILKGDKPVFAGFTF